MKAIVFMLGVFAGAAHSANSELEAFDFVRCEHWSISSDSVGSTDPVQARKRAAAQAHLVSRLGQAAESLGWWIFVATKMDNPDGADRYGACRLTNDGKRFECIDGSAFPLAGLSFVLGRSKGKLSTYVCAATCKAGTIKAVHDMGYENMEGETNVEQIRNASTFAKKCLAHAGR